MLLLLLFLLALLLYYRIYGRYRKTYENKSVDTSDIRYCAKFQPFVTSIFARNCKKRFCNFLQFCVFLLFWPLKWPQSSNLTWSAQHNLGVPNLFYFITFFVRSLSVPQKSILKFFLTFLILLFELWMPFLPLKTFWISLKLVDSYMRSTFSIFFHFYLNYYKVEELLSPLGKTTSTFELSYFVKWSKPCQTPPQTFWTESVLVCLSDTLKNCASKTARTVFSF